jgi:hypothetical protein
MSLSPVRLARADMHEPNRVSPAKVILGMIDENPAGNHKIKTALLHLAN